MKQQKENIKRNQKLTDMLLTEKQRFVKNNSSQNTVKKNLSVLKGEKRSAQNYIPGKSIIHKWWQTKGFFWTHKNCKIQQQQVCATLNVKSCSRRKMIPQRTYTN